MKVYPMSIVFSGSVTIGIRELAERLSLNYLTVTMMLKGTPCQVSEEYLDTVAEFNEEFAGELTLLVGEPVEL
jgi:hypothetical protein